MSLPKTYNHKEVEERWLNFWEQKGLFTPSLSVERPPFSMVIPPPNITGTLHIGHALNNTLQDVVARYKRMQGFDVLWLPGTDHAGIATQYVVEQRLLQEGKGRKDISKEEFLAKINEWSRYSQTQIVEQLKRLGASCDWTRMRYTMDKNYCRAVKEAFLTLYEEGYIYKDDYIINWCPSCRTALSDLEVVHKQVNGFLYYIRYPSAEFEGVCVATTRPETMFGDVAVAVNTADERYKNILGKRVCIPFAERHIPIIADEAVDKEFGTGALKITPAHDSLDFEIAKRHNLPPLKIFNEDATMNHNVPQRYQGKDRFCCREQLLEDLSFSGLLLKKETYRYSIGHCYRCGAVIEPLLSTQWFIDTKPLAEDAIKVVKEGKVEFVPKMWEKVYFEWMENIRPWCISRQIIWGHRIPIWCCKICGHKDAYREDKPLCKVCKSEELEQVPDVLDTWFSSALWPFATLGWPDKSRELSIFYPTSLLSTGFDIIFFWVARMIMMGLKFMKAPPFKKVYIHALIRDKWGQKMSKSRGNVIEPEVVIKEYGADALRFTLSALSVQGRDIVLSEERIEGYKHFCNKLWNATRFILLNKEGMRPSSVSARSIFDAWILTHLDELIEGVTSAMEELRFSDACTLLYDFFWHTFCDWYIESAKPRLEGEDRECVQNILSHVMKAFLRLLHPFMPYITEELWERMGGAESVLLASWPTASGYKDESACKKVEVLMEVVQRIRRLRLHLKIAPKKALRVWMKSAPSYTSLLTKESWFIKSLANLKEFSVAEDTRRPSPSLMETARAGQLYLLIDEKVQVQKERERVGSRLKSLEQQMERIKRRLSSEEFLKKAAPSFIKEQRMRLRDLEKEYNLLLEDFESLHE